MGNLEKSVITSEINQVKFKVQEGHDFSWLKRFGEVFCVYDEQDSGNISFGVKKDG